MCATSVVREPRVTLVDLGHYRGGCRDPAPRHNPESEAIRRALGDPKRRLPFGRRRFASGSVLTRMSEYPTLDVVKSDIAAKGAIAPPKPARAAAPAVDPLAAVRSHSVSELEADLGSLLRSAQPSCPLQEKAPDGSPRVPSLISVWLISQVGKAVGRPKLVNLSKVRRDDLRSLGGVARVVHRALHPVPSEAKAS